MDNRKAKEYCLFHINNKITFLYKNILMLMEDEQLPPDTFNKLRKRILDYGNDSIRDLSSIFEQSVDIDFKRN